MRTRRNMQSFYVMRLPPGRGAAVWAARILLLASEPRVRSALRQHARMTAGLMQYLLTAPGRFFVFFFDAG